MIRIIMFLVLTFLLHLSSISQSATEIRNSAYSAYKSWRTNKAINSEKLQEAVQFIDEAVQAKGGENDATSWHLRGFIYKDLFTTRRSSEKASNYRSIAIESFSRSIQLDKEGNLLEENTKGLRFLAVSHYNDVVDIIDTHDPKGIFQAEHHYSEYCRIATELQSDTVLNERNVEYFLAMSTAHRKIYETDRDEFDNHWQISNDYLNKVLEIDPNSFKALYSTGVAYYNRGAYNLERLPYVDIHDLMEIQSESMRSIEIALPFMIRAYEVDSSKIQAVRALRIINFNLNKIEESKQYELREQELGGIQPK
ncbi:MAG: hypothetical protein MK086_03205 [Flavobacteriales bacterium]|nr:hypothetical protein [Flavobacteriales bacterium]